jgi:carboxymethylenebutenolidase
VTFVTIDRSQQNPEQDAGTKGYLAVPDSPGPWPGVVLIPEVFGLEDNMIKHADRLASAGYLTLAVDTSGGLRGPRCVAASMLALRRGHGPQFDAIESARLWLDDRSDCTGRIGAIGFCVGGGFALLTASTGFEVTADNYGNLPSDLDAALDGACPIVANYGKRDRTLRGAAAKLEAALTRKGIEHDVREFENAGHAFLNEHEVGPRALLPLMRVMGVGPVPQAAAEAWVRIEDYFARHLH